MRNRTFFKTFLKYWFLGISAIGFDAHAKQLNKTYKENVRIKVSKNEKKNTENFIKENENKNNQNQEDAFLRTIKTKLNNVRYKTLAVTENGVDASDIDLMYEFLDGKISEFAYEFETQKMVIMDLSLFFQVFQERSVDANYFLDYYSENLVYDIFQSDFTHNWTLQFSKIELAQEKKSVANFSLKNEQQAKILVGSTQYCKSENGNEDVFIANDVHVAPCDSMIAWSANVKKFVIEKDRLEFKGNRFGIGNMQMPWLDLSIKHTPSSGFMVFELKKDELDGFLVDVPYYAYFEKQDFVIKPSFGKNFSMYLHSRSLINDDIILHSRFDMKYFSFGEVERGGYCNFYTQNFGQDVNVDMDVVFATSENYLKYYDRKENNTSKAFVSSHLYVMPDEHFRIGVAHFTNIKNNSKLLIPSLAFNKVSKFEEFSLRTDFVVNSFVREEDFFGKSMNSANANQGANKNTNQGANGNTAREQKEFIKSENVHYEGLISVAPRFFYSSYLQSSNEVGLHSVSTRSGDIYKIFGLSKSMFGAHAVGDFVFTPYLNFKLSHVFRDEFQNDVNAVSYSNIFNRNFEENVGYKSIDNGLSAGLRTHLGRFEFDTEFLRDSHNNFVCGGKYLYKKFFVYAKDYMKFRTDKDKDDEGNLKEKVGHDFFVGVGLNYHRSMFLVDYGIVEYNNNTYSKIACKFNVKITDDVLLNLEGIFSIKPLNSFISGGVKVVYNHAAWRFSLGCNYGNDSLDYKSDSNTLKFTFAINLNGADQFVSLYKRVGALKIHELADENVLDIFANAQPKHLL